MEESNIIHWDLIAKYLRGEATPAEKEHLFAWVNEGPENRALFNQLNNLWNATGNLPTGDDFQPNVDRAWQQFQARVDWNPVSEETLSPEGEEEDVFLRPDNAPHAFLGWRSPVWLRWATRVAAVVLLIAGAIFWMRFYFSGRSSEVLTQATENEKRVVYLPDSSRVYLNRHSQLLYAAGFSNGQRVVNLTGEAFFEVRKAAGKPFTIFSGNARTQVLGTSFNVRAYAQEKQVEVRVVTGKVVFSARSTRQRKLLLTLTAGTAAALTDANVLTQSMPNDPNGLAWKNERLSFDNTQLPQVIDALERYFAVPIRAENPQLLACRFTGSFERPDLKEILEVLKVSVNLSYSFSQGQYVLSGQGCR